MLNFNLPSKKHLGKKNKNKVKCQFELSYQKRFFNINKKFILHNYFYTFWEKKILIRYLIFDFIFNYMVVKLVTEY